MKSFQQLLPGLRLGQTFTALNLEQLNRVWSDIVGDYLSAKISPVRFYQGILTCYTCDSALLQEAKFLERQLLEKLHAYPWGKSIEKLNFTVRKELKTQQKGIAQKNRQARESAYQLKAATPNLSWKEVKELEASVAEIKEPQIREATLRLFKALKRRQASLREGDWHSCSKCQSYYEPDYHQCPHCEFK